LVGLQDSGSAMGMRIPMTIAAPADRGVAIARVLLLGVVVAMLMSTSVAIGFEFLTYIAFAVFSGPRRRLVQALRDPIVIGLLPFAAMVLIATFYGPTSWPNALNALVGWRRMLLLPLAAAVFDDDASKRLACKAFVAICTIGALGSFATAWTGYSILRTEPGIPFHNYAVQGISLAVAITICVAALVRPETFAGDRWLGDRRIMAIAAAVMMVDVVFVLRGRSGYLSLAIMAVAVVTFLVRGTWRAKARAGLAALLCAGVILGSSAHVRDRIGQALGDIETVDQVSEPTSIGWRVVFLRNTLRMVRDHPLFGVGTGGFLDGYQPYVEGVSGWQGEGTGDPHDQFLKVMGEQGLLGVAALLFLIFRAFTCPAPTPYRQVGAAVLIGWCATSLANSHFSTFVEGRLIFFWLGAMLATQTSARTS
jgi:O-antigen ligase